MLLRQQLSGSCTQIAPYIRFVSASSQHGVSLQVTSAQLETVGPAVISEFETSYIPSILELVCRGGTTKQGTAQLNLVTARFIVVTLRSQPEAVPLGDCSTVSLAAFYAPPWRQVQQS